MRKGGYTGHTVCSIVSLCNESEVSVGSAGKIMSTDKSVSHARL